MHVVLTENAQAKTYACVSCGKYTTHTCQTDACISCRKYRSQNLGLHLLQEIYNPGQYDAFIQLNRLSLAGNVSQLFPLILCPLHTAVAWSEERMPQLPHCRDLTDALHRPGQLHRSHGGAAE